MGKNGKRIDAANVNAFVVGVGRPAKTRKAEPVEEPTPVVEAPKPVEPAPVKAAAKKSANKAD